MTGHTIKQIRTDSGVCSYYNAPAKKLKQAKNLFQNKKLEKN